MTATRDELDVYIAGTLCGCLSQDRHGALSFEYAPQYRGVPLSMSMPVGLERYDDRIVRPYLMGLLPDDTGTRALIGSRFNVSGNNPFKLLSHIGLDCPGAVQISPHGADLPSEPRRSSLVELSEADIESKLAAVRSNAASAWIGTNETGGRWSLAGCQAKLALRKQNGKWYDCASGAASTHILKPGVTGLTKQAFVEYVSMKTAEEIGLPVAKTEYRTFGSEPAIIVERYDRIADGEGEIHRIHQEDICQALSVSPDAKYAEQGGPTTPQIIELLKETGRNASDNVHRFILYVFFNYLIGATDGHAKNHALLFASPSDIRLAPLYDVASITPYRSLASSKRKPLRCALSIGSENRFGMLKTEHIEKMVTNCRLNDFELGTDALCRQFTTMAELIPGALETVLTQIRLQNIPDIDEITKKMQVEITSNCARSLP